MGGVGPEGGGGARYPENRLVPLVLMLVWARKGLESLLEHLESPGGIQGGRH